MPMVFMSVAMCNRPAVKPSCRSSYGENCPSIDLRSVFVDWDDQQGNYGFEQIDY